MEAYIFILGRNPELSRAELLAVLEKHKITYNILEESELAIILETSSIKPTQLMKELGGIQKIAKIIKEIDNLYQGTKNKIRYAISNYTFEDDEEIKDQLKQYFKRERLKATIKKSHHQQAYLTPSEAQDVLEIILYEQYIALTQAIFMPSAYKKRDEQRPYPHSDHALSIRLAKILLNLAQAKKGDTIIDPFSDIGTIIQEASLQGINTIAVTEEKKALEKNTQWLKKTYNINTTVDILDNVPKKKVKAVITQAPLGPTLRSTATEGEAKKTLRNLLPVYKDFLEKAAKRTKTIVFISPIIKTKSRKELSLPLKNICTTLGLKIEQEFIESSPKSKILKKILLVKNTKV